MLDLLDFQPDKGGDLKKLKDNQRRRHAPESIIDDVVALFEDHKKSSVILLQTCVMLKASSEIRRHSSWLEDKCEAKGDWTKEESLVLF